MLAELTLKQDLVFQGSGLSSGNNPDGRPSPDRAFVLTYAAPDAFLEIYIRSLNRQLSPIRPAHNPFAGINRLWRCGAVFFTDDTGGISRPGEASPPIHIGRTDSYRPIDLLFPRNIPYGPRGAETTTQGARIFAVPLGHYEILIRENIPNKVPRGHRIRHQKRGRIRLRKTTRRNISPMNQAVL